MGVYGAQFLIKGGAEEEMGLEWIHQATKHVQRWMDRVITNDVMQADRRVVGR
jgi:hypothetical protein